MEILGVESIFIVASVEKHNCSAETCQGHSYMIEHEGFNDDELGGIVVSLAEDVIGHPLDLEDED
jgi:hypothetical protein